jgi:basic membrane lipoprotein Med (substrate-binding protein (PBP1-ABC) superfamily)
MDTRPPLRFGSALIAVLVLLACGSSTVSADAVRPQVVAFLASDDEGDQATDKAEHARNAGVVEGEVLSVDYQRGLIALQSPKRGRVDVFVLPSTNIQGRGDSFHTIADISRGSRLRIFLSRRAGRFIAQIIHLR